MSARSTGVTRVEHLPSDLPSLVEVGSRNGGVPAVALTGRTAFMEEYGVTLSFAKELQRMMADRQVELPVVMGEILNGYVVGGSLPVDVSQDLEDLGVRCCAGAEDVMVAAREVLGA